MRRGLLVDNDDTLRYECPQTCSLHTSSSFVSSPQQLSKIMEQEPVVSKSKIMRLAYGQIGGDSSTNWDQSLENEPTLDASSLNLHGELCNASKEGALSRFWIC